ncbi:hypothetical protein LWI29_031860 [Acer saccharum]|uniref:Uncharacterized protein n=1 Tax=Acer saccharum TaxID=4024 RepID=A0AA39W4N2_ACESA|nr:hypothetical protein LWI29_031860 [Acer saccharum]
MKPLLILKLQNEGCPVLGIDFKVNSCDNKIELLILCGVNHCLLIKLPNIHSYPRSLAKVLSDRNLCFVGIGIRDKIPGLTLESVYWKSDDGKPLSFYKSAIVEVCDLAAKVLKKPKLCKCGLAELDKEVRINSTVASTASSTSSCPVTDSKVTEEIASLPDSKVNVEIANLPDLKVKVEKASLPEMIECIPDWKAVAFSDEEIKFEYGINLRIHVVLIIIAIPMKYLSKIGTYEVDFQGAKVKAILVTNEAILEAKIAELRSSLQRQKCSVVGIDFKLYTGKKAELMILCSLNVCLIIKLAKIHSTPYNLCVCFVGNGIRDKLPSLTLVNELCGLAELNKEVRINTVDSTTASSSSCLLPPVSKVKVEKANLPVNL